MTVTTNISAPAAVFTDETLGKAAGLAANAYQPVWIGQSGEQVSGEAVARHLEAATVLLDKDGWVRTYDYSKTWGTSATLAADESMTVKDMVRALLAFVREESGDTEPHRTLLTALRHVGEGAHGDSDTAAIASDVLDLVVRAHTGCDTARATVWSERLHRTHADITALLMAGARFARAYGPAGHGA
jgi:hypothetical protein